MKTLSTLLAAVILTCLFGTGKAETSSLFHYNREAMNTELSQLNRLEEYVQVHEGVTATEMKQQGSALADNVQETSSFSAYADDSKGPLGIPSFLWGCVLGWVGILIVYLILEDKEQTKKALIGCIIGYAVEVVGVCILYFALIAAEASLFWY